MDPAGRRRTQEAMVRLDPILQWLLNLVNQYQECMDKRVADGYSEDINTVDEEKALGIIRAQVQLLQRLQQTLENLVHDTTGTVGSSMATTKNVTSSASRGLSILSEYMSLPLNAILQITSKELAVSLGSSASSSTANQSTPDEHERPWKIRASSVRKLQQETARTITMYVEKCSSVSATSDIEDTFEGQPRSQQDKCALSPFPATKTTYVPNAHVVRFLISLATALPTGAPSAQSPKDSSPSSPIPSGDGHTSTSSLDNGIDCHVSILNAITTLMSYAGPSNEGLANDIAKALNGVLLARIADACSFFLLQVTAPAVLPSSSYASSSLRRLQPQSVHLAIHALQTLDAMFQAIPNETTLWQAMFPGIFAALHRFWMRLRRLVVSSGLASEMQCHGLRTMARFLRLTLTTTTINPTGKTGPKESTVLVLAELQSLAKQAKKPRVVDDATQEATVSRVESTGQEKKTMEAEFLEQVNARVVAPLTTLIQTIPHSPLVKVEAVSICRAILLDTRTCWKKNSRKELFNLTLECCLLLQQDHDERVSSSASKFLQDFQRQGYLGSDMSNWIVPRITEIIVEELPTLVQRQDGSDMRGKLKIVRGYLSLVSGSRQAQVSLAAARTTLLQALIPLFDVDFGSPTGEAGVLVMGAVPMIVSRYIGAEDVNVAKTTVRELGRALGIKYGTLAVDSCIADFYEAFLSRVENTAATSQMGASHSEWLHEWIGCFIVSREILTGAFTSKENEENSAEENFKKLERKKQRALHSLASSVLPIITQSLLWDLPLHADDKTHPPTSPLLSRGVLVETTDKMLVERPLKSSSATFLGNGIVIRLLLELVAQFCDLLQESAESYLYVILYPVIRKASQGGAPLVQFAAATVLHRIAVVCGYHDSPGLIRKHFDQLVTSMIGCLRIPGGKLVPGDDSIDEIISVASSLRFVLQSVVSRSERSAGRRSLERNSKHCMVEIVTLLTERYNHLIVRKAVNDEKFFELIAVYTASFSFLLVSYGAKDGCKYTYRIGSTMNEPSSKPWRAMIAPFRVSASDHLSPEEGFAQTAALMPQDKELEHARSIPDSHDVSILEIEFVSRLVSKCCYFLSYNSLRMRIASCDALISGFRFLAFVSCYQENNVTEENSVRTAILRQIGSSWSAVEARLSTTSEHIVASQRVKSVVVFRPAESSASSSSVEDLATQRIFLSKLFGMIAAMVEGSGSFMADRVTNEVWPILSKQLDLLISKRTHSYYHHHNNNPIGKNFLVEELSRGSGRKSSGSSDWQTSETILILAILEFLERVFGEKDCGMALSNLVTSAGTLILPFLDDNDEKISNASFSALQKMVEIDCDALWRPLLHLSGQCIPLHPLRSELSAQDDAASLVLPSHLLARKARELITHIESLPEQIIW